MIYRIYMIHSPHPLPSFKKLFEEYTALADIDSYL